MDILKHGVDVKVTEPNELREMVVQQLQNAISLSRFEDNPVATPHVREQGLKLLGLVSARRRDVQRR
jgi:hypothetical protein